MSQVLAGTRFLAYIELMGTGTSSGLARWLPLLLWGALTAPAGWAGPPQLVAARGWDLDTSVGGLRIVPSLQATPNGFWGPAATVETASGWYAGASLGRLSASLDNRPSYRFTDARTLSAGYRWADSNRLALSVTSASALDLTGSRVQRLGLAVRYDWPTYYVRLGLDPRPPMTSQETLRLSAGFSF